MAKESSMSSEQWRSNIEPGMLERWLLLCIEITLNKGLELNPGLKTAFNNNSGKVVALKARDPFYSLYMIFTVDGVRLVNQYKGKVDARLRIQAKDLVWFFLGPELLKSGYKPSFQAVGDESLIQVMREFADDWDFWQVCRGILKEWLPEFESLESLFGSLRKKDPVWVEKIEKIPELVDHIIAELRSQSKIQEKQLQALTALEKNVRMQQYQILVLMALLIMMFLINTFE